MKKLRAGRIAALFAAAVLFSLVLSVSAAAHHFPLQITRDLPPVYEAARGEHISLSVEAVGSGDISYQWYNHGGPIFRANGPDLDFNAISDDEVYCVVRCGGEDAESTHCFITLSEPRVPVSAPIITLQPKDVSLSYGQTGVLSVQAVCANQDRGLEIVYQWYASSIPDFRYASPIRDADSPNYIIPPSYAPSKMYYLCEVYSTNGTDESEKVFSSVACVYCGELTITKHPTGETVNVGGNATFIAAAEGAASFQWRIVKNDGSNGFYRADEAPSYINGLQVIGADSNTLVLKNIPASMNGMSVICVFYADNARTQFKITNSARLTVNQPYTPPTPTPTPYIPRVTAAPAITRTVYAPSVSVRPELSVSEDGRTVSLSVIAVDNNSAGTALKYQWYRNTRNSNSGGTAIAGARSASYMPANSADGSYYYVGVWATDGSTTSKVVYSDTVLLEAPAPERSTILAPSISIRPDVSVSENGRNAHLSILAVDNNDDGTELRFQWYRNTRNSNAGGTAIASARYDNYNPIILNLSRYYYVGVWATDGKNVSKVVYSEPVLVSTSALSETLLAPSVSVRPELMVSEDGNDVSLSVRAVDNNRSGTELKFQWYRSRTNSVSGGKIIPGADEANFVPTLSSEYKYYYVAVWATDGRNVSKTAYSGPVLVG